MRILRQKKCSLTFVFWHRPARSNGRKCRFTCRLVLLEGKRNCALNQNKSSGCFRSHVGSFASVSHQTFLNSQRCRTFFSPKFLEWLTLLFLQNCLNNSSAKQRSVWTSTQPFILVNSAIDHRRTPPEFRSETGKQGIFVIGNLEMKSTKE